MDGRQRMKDILAHKSGHCGFWHGNPNPSYQKDLFQALGVSSDFEMGL